MSAYMYDELAAAYNRLRAQNRSLVDEVQKLKDNAGLCPTCNEWAGRGKGCEWCSEFAQESGWNDD